MPPSRGESHVLCRAGAAQEGEGGVEEESRAAGGPGVGPAGKRPDHRQMPPSPCSPVLAARSDVWPRSALLRSPIAKPGRGQRGSGISLPPHRPARATGGANGGAEETRWGVTEGTGGCGAAGLLYLASSAWANVPILMLLWAGTRVGAWRISGSAPLLYYHVIRNSLYVRRHCLNITLVFMFSW